MSDTKFESEKIEAQKRFEALPENLKKEMLADKNVQVIVSTCQDYKLSEEDTKKVVLLAGEVFLGYIKPEEVASELNKYFGVELQKSNFIEIELKQKIFNGLKADLDKVYNPLKIETTPEEEASPVVIKLESAASPKASEPRPEFFEREAAPISGVSAIPLQKPSEIITEKKPEAKVSPFIFGSVSTQPASRQSGDMGQAKTETPATPKAIPVLEKAALGKGEPRPDDLGREEAPFIIQTKIEAVKAAVPQFPKETPSLNLKVDPSIIQKSSAVKPIPVHLETAQPVQEKRFQMPVIAGQKIFSGTPVEKVSEKPSAVQSLRVPPKPCLPAGRNLSSNQIAASQTPRNDEKVLPTTLQATQQQPLSSPSLKEISEQKTASPLVEQKPFVQTPSSAGFRTGEQGKPAMPEQAKEAVKTVHYSSFKTDLTHPSLAGQEKAASPKAGEPRPVAGREDFINLNTFTKISGNTVDLRKSG